MVERGYHAHYELRGEHRLGRSVHDVDAGYVMGPMSRGLRVTTGVELAPRDAPSNLVQLEQVEPRVREAIDVGERTADPLWRGARPTLPDSRPAIGAVPGTAEPVGQLRPSAHRPDDGPDQRQAARAARARRDAGRRHGAVLSGTLGAAAGSPASGSDGGGADRVR